MKSGEIYIKMPDSYGNLNLGCYSVQSESMNFIGSEERSAYGSLKIFNIAGKMSYSLQSPPFNFEEYIKIRNYILARMGTIEEVFIDTEGGFKLCKVRVAGQRLIAADGTNDKFSINLQIEEG